MMSDENRRPTSQSRGQMRDGADDVRLAASDESIGDYEKDAGLYSADDRILLALGKIPKMKRVYNFWTLCAYQVMMSGTWACVVVLYGTVFDIGGPISLLYGSIIVATGQTILMASLAEYCGIWPTAGGQQYYVQALATPKWRPLLSYMLGWGLIAAEISVSAGCALNSADIISSFVSAVYPELQWKNWMTFVIYLPMIGLPLLTNLNSTLLTAYSAFGGVLTVAGFLGWAITFLVMAPKSSASFVFTKFLNNTGYSSSGWVFIMGFYNSIYGLYGTDAMMHLVEDMRDASRDAPRAMVWSMVFAGITTVITDLILLFCCGNYGAYAKALSPYVSWFIDITGSLYGGGLFVTILFCLGNFLVSAGTMATVSRLGWRMAEDKAFPCSEWLAKLHPRYDIPLNFMYMVLVAELLLGLISLGSNLAFYAIVSGSGVFFQLSYALPVIMVLIRGRAILPPRPHFDLGRCGLILNSVSVAWALLVVVLYLFPLYLPVNAANIANMNFAIVIVALEVLCSGGYWLYGARYKYLKDVPQVAPVLDCASVGRGKGAAGGGGGSGG